MSDLPFRRQLVFGAGLIVLLLAVGFLLVARDQQRLNMPTEPALEVNQSLPFSKNEESETKIVSHSQFQEKKKPQRETRHLQRTASALPDASTIRVESDPNLVEQIVDGLIEISASYNPERLVEIEPYLYCPNSAVRTAAVDAVLNLGSEAGADLLHRASYSMLDSREAKETLEKAAFLRLPSGVLKSRKNPDR
jgi:hypothetical protein